MGVELAQLPWARPFNLDVATAFDKVAHAFAGDPAQPAAWRDAIARVTAQPRDRGAIAAALAAQQSARQTPEAARANAARLADPRTVVVATGQQAGVFGGPIFTLLKALTAIKLARGSRRRTACRRCRCSGSTRRITTGTKSPAVRFSTPSWRRRPSASARVRVRVRVRSPPSRSRPAPPPPPSPPCARRFPPTEFTAALLDTLGPPLRGWRDAGARLRRPDGRPARPARPGRLRRLRSGHQAARRRAVRPRAVVARRDVRSSPPPPAPPSRRAATRRRLRRAPRRPRCSRSARRASRSGAPTPATTRSAIARWAVPTSSPTRRRTPNASARTCCCGRSSRTRSSRPSPTSAGPSEVAYFAQLKDVYAHFGLPMPLIVPRATATFVDGAGLRFLQKAGVELGALQARDDAALNRLLEQTLPRAVEDALQAARADRRGADGRPSSPPSRPSTRRSRATAEIDARQDDPRARHAAPEGGPGRQATRRHAAPPVRAGPRPRLSRRRAAGAGHRRGLAPQPDRSGPGRDPRSGAASRRRPAGADAATGFSRCRRRSARAASIPNLQLPTPKERPTPNNQPDRLRRRVSSVGRWKLGVPWQLAVGNWEFAPAAGGARSTARPPSIRNTVKLCQPRSPARAPRPPPRRPGSAASGAGCAI